MRPRPRRIPPGRSWLALGALLLFVPSCGGEDAALRVDGVAFTEDELLGLSADRAARLAELTALGLAFARDEPERLGAPLLQRRRENLLLERFRASLVLERSGVDEASLRAQYRTDPRDELVVRHVVALADPQDPDSVHRAARRRAERAQERIESGESMAEVAADLSEEPGAAERGGRLEPGRRGSWVAGFWQAANALEEGEHTGVVNTRYGYHVIRLEERRTVPFEEVRSEVVLESGRMLGGMEEAWTAWTDSVGPTVRIDTAAVQRWRERAGAVADSATLARDTLPGDTASLARFSAGSAEPYTLGSFRRHAAGLEEEAWTEVAEGPLERTLAEVRREAVRHRALRSARERGLGIPASEEERLAREWRDRVAVWAASLGFAGGAAPSEVKEQALEALAATRQNARIARRELEPRGPLLRAAYPVRGLPPETGSSSGS